MKLFIFLSLCLLLLISQVNGVTLSPVIRFNETMKAGQSTTFDATFTPSPSEGTVTFESIVVYGDCSSWVTTNKQSMVFNKSASVGVAIAVPKDATNGRHRCDIAFASPSMGMVQQVLELPITINVVNGTTPTIAPTKTPTPKPTTIKPLETTTTTPKPKTTYTPLGLWVSFIALPIPFVFRRYLK